MSAPFFCTISILKQDLKLLQCPYIEQDDDDTMFQTHGQARIILLAWLANDIDPTLKLDIDNDDINMQQLAKFWDHLGVHTATKPNASGFYMPLTTPGRPRDKACAFVFLRAAIDLVFSFRRIRQHNQPENTPAWLHQNDTQHPNDLNTVECNDMDIQLLKQMDMLIVNRHKLFHSVHYGNQFPQQSHPLNQRYKQNHQQQQQQRQPLSQRIYNSNIPSSPKKSPSYHSSTSSPSLLPRSPRVKVNNTTMTNTMTRKKPPLIEAHYNSSKRPPTISEKRLINTSSRKTTSSSRIKQQQVKRASSFHSSASLIRVDSQHRNSNNKKLNRISVFQSNSQSPSPLSPSTPKKKGMIQNINKSSLQNINNKMKTREFLIDRLRILRREATDFESKLPPCSPTTEHVDDDTDQIDGDLDDDEYKDSGKMIVELTENANIVSKLASQFSNIVDEAHAIRITKGRKSIKRDNEMEKSLDGMIPSCKTSMKSISNVIFKLGRMKLAVNGLHKHAQLIEQLSESDAVRSVVRQQYRTQYQL